MKKDEDYLYYTRQEIIVLENMLNDLKIRERYMLKEKNQQGWLDYILEWLGY
jgi:hypothetical protein